MINSAGAGIIKRRESKRLVAYLCPAGVPTIGYGHTATVSADDVRAGRRITSTQCEQLFARDVEDFESGVRAALTQPATENQLAAMVSLAFNIGIGAFRASSVLKAHNRGDYAAAARAFALWNKATVGGKKVVLPGLVARRAEEAALYLEPAGQPAPMPQAVADERPMTSSRIVQGGTVAAGASMLAMASEAARQVAEIRESLGPWFPYVVLGVAAAASVWVVYERFIQRRNGIA